MLTLFSKQNSSNLATSYKLQVIIQSWLFSILILITLFANPIKSFGQISCYRENYIDSCRVNDSLYNKKEKIFYSKIKTRGVLKLGTPSAAKSVKSNTGIDIQMVPVVVHIITNPLTNPSYSISAAQVDDQINVMNEAFSGQYGGVDTRIQFCLARTSGINWTNPGEIGIMRYSIPLVVEHTWDAAGIANIYNLTSSGSSINAIFPEDHYLNIYVVESINGNYNTPTSLGAYTGEGLLASIGNNITAIQMSGIVIRADLFGGPNFNSQMMPNSPTFSSTSNPPPIPGTVPAPDDEFNQGKRIVHELAHYFSVLDIFSKNAPPPFLGTNFCYGDEYTNTTMSNYCEVAGDYCCDTWPCFSPTGYYNCTLNPTPPIDCISQQVQVDNFMYLSWDNCVNNFTQEQSVIMNGYIDIYKTDLVSIPNLIFTGLFNNTGGCINAQPIADFNINGSTTNINLCVGETYTLQPFAQSPINTATQFDWQLNGSNNVNQTTTSATQNVTCIWSSAGTYTITCTASNTGSITDVVNLIVNVDDCNLNPNFIHNSNWYWGQYASFDFNSGTPIVATNPRTHIPPSINTKQQTFTYSDDNGNVVFYTDGQNIYNNNDDLINGGFPITPVQPSTQDYYTYPFNTFEDHDISNGILCIQMPNSNNNNNFYFFGRIIDQFGVGNRFYRAITLNPFSMGPIQIIDPLATSNIWQDFNLIPHCNGRDFWYITSTIEKTSPYNLDYIIKLKSYLVNECGVASEPSSSIINNFTVTPFAPLPFGGNIKCSPNNLMIAMNGTHDNYTGTNATAATLFDFEPSTGLISNQTSIFGSNNADGYVDLTFSANSQFIYGANGGNFNILDQYDIANNSATLLYGGNYTDDIFTQLQLGPDNNIYMLNQFDLNNKHISTIKNANTNTPTVLIENLDLNVLPHIYNGPKSGLKSFPKFIDGIKPPAVPFELTRQRVDCNTLKISAPTCWGGYYYQINWGDGSPVLNLTTVPVNLQHTYATNGVFNITVNLFLPYTGSTPTCSLSHNYTFTSAAASMCCAAESIDQPGTLVFSDATGFNNANAVAIIATFGSNNITTTNNIIIDGNFLVDKYLHFFNCPNIKFTPNSKITIQNITASPIELYVEQSTLKAACNQQWDGIFDYDYPLTNPSSIRILNSTVMDMQNGITFYNGSMVNAQLSNFYNNDYSLTFINNYNLNTQKIAGNNFQTISGKLGLAPRMISAIRFFECSNAIVGPFGGTYNIGNTFDNMENGIYIRSSAVAPHQFFIQGNTFTNINSTQSSSALENTPLITSVFFNNQLGCAVFGINGNSKLYLPPTILTAGNYFESCTHATVINNFNSEFHNNDVQSCSTGLMQSTGIGGTKDNMAAYNTMDNVDIGIYSNDAYYSEIWLNTISLSSTIPSDNTIPTDAFLNSCAINIDNSTASILQTSITNNTIALNTAAQTAISVNNINGGPNANARISYNNITMNGINTTIPFNNFALANMTGIRATSCSRFKFYENIINGNSTHLTAPANGIYNSGINLNTSLTCVLRCNEISNTRYGFYIFGNCFTPNTQILNVGDNTFNNHFNGMYFRNFGAILGSLGTIGRLTKDPHNLFLGTYNTVGTTLRKIRAVAFCTGNSSPHKYYSKTSIIKVSNPQSVGLNCARYPVINAFNFFPDFSCANVPQSQYKVGEIGDDTLVDQDYDLDVAGDSIDYVVFDATCDWTDEQQLYNDLYEDSLRRATNTMLDSFFVARQASDIEDIRQEDELIELMSDTLTRLDSVLFAQALQNAKAANDSIFSTRIAVQNILWMNKMNFKIIEQGIDSITTNEKTILYQLANSCPLEKGKAVYRARAMVAKFSPGAIWHDNDICAASVGSGKNLVNPFLTNSVEEENENTETNLNSTSQSIAVYPNPSKNIINISYNLERNQQAIFNILDMQGKIIKSIICDSRYNLQQMNVANLATGIYTYSYIVNGVSTETGKLQISK